MSINGGDDDENKWYINYVVNKVAKSRNACFGFIDIIMLWSVCIVDIYILTQIMWWIMISSCTHSDVLHEFIKILIIYTNNIIRYL